MTGQTFEIKIAVEAQLQQLRAMEDQLSKQIVQMRTLGDVGSDSLKKLETQLGQVRTALENVSALDKFKAGLGDTLKEVPVVGHALSLFNGSALSVGTGLAVATYAAEQFHAAIEFADNLQDVAQQLGVTASGLQTLNVHFEKAGIHAPQVAQTMQRLGMAMEQAAAGSLPLQAAFAALGLDIATLRDLAPDEALARLGRALSDHAGSAEAASAAQMILGRSTGKLVNSLKELGEVGLEKTKASIAESGQLLEDDVVKRLADANQKLEALDRRWTIFKANVADKAMSQSLIDIVAMKAVGAVIAMKGPKPATADGLDTLGEEHAADRQDAAAAAVRVADAARTAKAEADARAAVSLKAQDELDEQLRLAALADLKKQIGDGNAVYLADQEKTKNAKAKDAVESDKLSKLKAQADLADQIAASDAKIAAIDADRFKTQAQKDAERIVALRAQNVDIQTQIDKLKKLDELDPTPGGDPTRQNQIRDYKAKVTTNTTAITAATPLSGGESIVAASVAMQDQIGSPAEQVGQAWTNVAETMRTSMGGAFADMIWKAESFKDAMAGFGLSIAQSFVNSVSQMVADWIMSHIVMQEVKAAFHAWGIGEQAAATTTEVGIHAGGEAAKTTATAGGAAHRAVIRIGETLFHAAQVAWRTITHIAGEAAKTASTLLNAGIRIGSIVMESIAYVFQAAVGALASMASIPYVGPILAVVAMAAMIGAGMAMVGKIGHADGGLITGPGTGTSDSIPAYLSNGEYVIPAARVSQYGQSLFDDIRAGRPLPSLANSSPASASSGASGGGGAPVINMAFFDSRQSAEKWAASQQGRAHIVDVVQQNLHQISGS